MKQKESNIIYTSEELIKVTRIKTYLIMSLYLIFAFIALIISMWVKVDNTHVGMEFILHCFAIIMVLCAFATYNSSPEAIDVYRGKTTIEITYKDSIPVDSVVVFKERR